MDHIVEFNLRLDERLNVDRKSEKITWGKGSAKLVDVDFADVYEEILDNLGIDYEEWSDYLFLEKLTNGGQKGAGLKVLELAIKKAKELRKQLLIFVLSKFEDSEERQEKLRNWYLSTGLLRQTKLSNILAAK